MALKKPQLFSGLRSVDARDLARERATHEAQQREPLTRILGVSHLKKFLEVRGHADACAQVESSITECNPWAFEPVLLDELIRARLQHVNPETMNKLRDLVRAGSWNTYPRQTQAEVLTLLSSIKSSEERHWDTRIRHADPDTSREYHTYANEARESIERVERDIREHRLGEQIEYAVRTVEDLQLRAYGELKKISIAHRCTIQEARELPAGKPLAKEIERLRPIRDLLYFRRAHGDWAARSGR